MFKDKYANEYNKGNRTHNQDDKKLGNQKDSPKSKVRKQQFR